jgi:hypothetical protein
VAQCHIGEHACNIVLLEIKHGPKIPDSWSGNSNGWLPDPILTVGPYDRPVDGAGFREGENIVVTGDAANVLRTLDVGTGRSLTFDDHSSRTITTIRVVKIEDGKGNSHSYYPLTGAVVAPLQKSAR